MCPALQPHSWAWAELGRGGCGAGGAWGREGGKARGSRTGWVGVVLTLLSAPRPLWRPWLPRAEEGTGKCRAAGGTEGSGGPHPPHHASPHRLLWPKSKCFDYLYAVGEKLLENFPVQATLCLYEDSGSEEEDEEEEDEEEEDEEEEDEEEAGAVPAGPPPHAGSDARPAARAATGAAAGDTGPRR
uniref:Ripply transcriptional repressor 1 n=1 Tax=Amazona collaria TaxID=241587 RepID=A0A8B9IXS4_9PSIT